MASGFIQSGRRIKVNTASAAITSGAYTVQEGFGGVALTGATSGSPFWIGIEGVWNMAVPASTVKGDYLAVPGINGDPTEGAAPTVSRTPTATDTLIGRALTDRDASGNAYVLLAAQASAKASTQV